MPKGGVAVSNSHAACSGTAEASGTLLKTADRRILIPTNNSKIIVTIRKKVASDHKARD